MRKGEKLPLFPLNLVLYPQMKLPLHIFEERYKHMVARCLENDEPFGVVLIRSGGEVGDEAEPYLIGTTARIHMVEQLDGGRLNLLVEGEERFRIRRLDTESHLYMLGTVEPVEELPLPASALARRLLKHAQQSFRDYLELLFAVHNVKVKVQFPKDAAILSFAMAMAVEGTPLQKQHYLEITDTLERFLMLIPIVQRQTDEMRQRRTIVFDRARYAKEYLSLN